MSSAQRLASSKRSMRRLALVLFVVLVAMAALGVEPAEGLRQDLMFVKGKFIKKDPRGVVVVDDDKCPSCCCHQHHHGGMR